MTSTRTLLVLPGFSPAPLRRAAAAAALAVVAAVALAACGPRDEAPLAGGAAATPAVTSAPPTAVATAAAPAVAGVDARIGSPVPAATATAPVVAVRRPRAQAPALRHPCRRLCRRRRSSHKPRPTMRRLTAAPCPRDRRAPLCSRPPATARGRSRRSSRSVKDRKARASAPWWAACWARWSATSSATASAAPR